MEGRRGATIIDLVISLGIVAFLFGAIYLVYFSILRSTTSSEYRTEAISVLNRQVEIVRNLPYDQVGTQGGVPAGILPPSQQVAFGGRSYTVSTTVRNVDDPFDGTAGGTPNDAAPADYKLVEFEISCPACDRLVPFALTTTVAPKNLESASSTGSLFVNAFDAAGGPISGATVRIVNASVTPAIDFTDVTNLQGALQLVGIPTSTQRYDVSVSKSGYSSDRTYLIGDAANPNPITPHATVASQSVSSLSFAIDRVSQLTVYTSDDLCAAVGNQGFSVRGSKIIGTAPDVLKYPTSTFSTDASGARAVADLEWDTYAMLYTGAGYDLLGTVPLPPFIVNPSSTADFRFVLAAEDPNALLVSVKDASGNGVDGASVRLTRPGFDETRTAGRRTVSHTSWAGGAYAGQSGQVDADGLPGSLRLLANASGTYPAGPEWLESVTFDLGSASGILTGAAWSGNTPPSAGAESVKFQLAANNDGATWNYAGPDGTAGTFYTATSSDPHAALDGRRYVRYKIFLSTADGDETPRLDEFTLEFSGNCAPPAQAAFTGLSNFAYTLEVSAPGFQTATSSITASAAWQQTTMTLNP